MSDRFWIGRTGNWSNTANWSATTGGAGGASLPTNLDRAIFDANSFNAAGQIVTVDTPASCLDMVWTGATNSPTLAGSTTLNVYGSLTLISTLTWSLTTQVAMSGAATGFTVTTAGVTLAGGIKFFANGGGWTLQDNLTVGTTITLTFGTLDTNGKSVSCSTFTITGTNARTLTLGASVITCATWTATTITSLTFNPNTSTIVVTGATTFAGGGLTYNSVTLTGTSITITGSNTFNTLTLTAGKTVNLTSGTTQTVTNLFANGTTASPSTLQAVTAGSTATIALPAGRYFIRHTSIKDITITGATAVTSIAGTNVSGNTGITFVTKFEMGRIKNDGSFNWYSTATGAVTKVSG